MSELTSTEFRKTFAKLEEPTLVTVNGHPIGVWTPVTIAWEERDGAVNVDIRPGRAGASAQAQRDDLLRKINRG